MLGSSFLSDKAFIAANPPIPSSQIADSAPTTSIFLASPIIMLFAPSQIAWVEAAHAVTLDKLGPLKPCAIDTIPPSILTSADGIKKGEILLGPFVEHTIAFFSIFGSPPIPEAELTPNSSPSKLSNFASSIASAAAFKPSWINLSIFFTSLPSSTTLRGSKPLTSAAIWTGSLLASNEVTLPTPVLPPQIALKELSLSRPSAFIMPIPVTTTLFKISPLTIKIKVFLYNQLHLLC